MRKSIFKFILENSSRYSVYKSLFDLNDKSPENLADIKEYTSLIPADNPGFPARENGVYYIKWGRGTNIVYVYFNNEWWQYDKPQAVGHHYSELAPDVCMSQAEIKACRDAIKLFGRDALSKKVANKYWRYVAQKELRQVEWSIKLSMYKFDKKRPIDKRRRKQVK